MSSWSGYGQFWAQILRETARRPQSRRMDVRIGQTDGRAGVTVDLLEDAAHFRNEAVVVADVYLVAAGQLGSSMEAVSTLTLEQTAPGRYESSFIPEASGVYLVRARCGADTVTAGLVHNSVGETATGQVNRRLLESVAKITGGTVLKEDQSSLTRIRASHSRFIELMPLLLKAFLLLFVLDVASRRWENVMGMVSVFGRR